jgi:hypothetical protein
MNRYRIINTVSGSDLGIFDAADEQGALDAMAREAGYKPNFLLGKEVCL